jgi:tripartite-type tricarboxylate transporter receptor subunit TctC
MSQLQADVIAGQVPLAFSTIPGALPHIQAGRMSPLAVSGARRAPVLPNVPTVAEAGVPGYEATTWYPILAPAGTPRAIVEKLNADLNGIVTAPDMKERFQAMGVDAIGSTPEALAAHIKSELTKWAKVVQLSGARVD